MRKQRFYKFHVGVLSFALLAAGAAGAVPYKPMPARYGERYCDLAGFHCITIGKSEIEREVVTKNGAELVKKIAGGSWNSMWPDADEREIVMKINRMNIRPRRGMVIAVPDNMKGKTYLNFAPFPRFTGHQCDPSGEEVCRLECVNCDDGVSIKYRQVCEQKCKPDKDLSCAADGTALGEKVIIIDLARLAFAAYDEKGDLLRWGPVAGGKDWGRYVRKDNLTVVGDFSITKKYGRWAKSRLYPRATKDKKAGGAPVPYFMNFFPGYGLHYYHDVPGRHASHGCVRMFFDDAKWLNLKFAKIGTKVIVRPYE